MFKSVRQSKIRSLVNDEGQVAVADLIDLLAVSEATIRRDLEELHVLGHIRRTHGGAIRAENGIKELPMLQRKAENPEKKSNIGKAAIQFIKDGDTIFLGSGTTVIEIARNLPKDISLTVITNSLAVVNELATNNGIELIVIGGMLRQSELSMVGHVAEQAVREFRADKVFIGMYAVDVDCGFTNDFPPEILTDRAIMNISHQVIVVADHSKFGRVSSMLVAPVTAADVIITDQDTPQNMIDQINERGIQVIQA